ncbi:MAG: DUF3575 domain-containing protein [Rikenellaceae bacterium]|nr:DUF3575 domain-containing protein [Rikenellaceae bacterium]MCL2692708.1 DUF3575 domain-containing protein [Rikenellaceae bacterium]
MKKVFLTMTLLFAVVASGHAQKIAVKTNGLGLVTFAGFGQWSPTPNLGAEIALWPRWTLDIDGFWNPFTFGENKSTQFWAVQPELRYWFCGKFNGHFVGLHGQYAEYQNFGMRKYVYDGHLAGLGLSYGYSLPLAPRWKLEFNLGFGWNDVNSKTVWLRESSLGRPIGDYGPGYGNVEYQEPIRKDYWGITRAGVNVVFIIR